jgi:hypothetical protein
MGKLWAVPALVVVGGVFVVACSPGSDPVTGGGDGADEDAVVSQLPLSEECSACAGDSIGSTCGDQLDACLDSEDCLDVQGCFEGCDPNDSGCFAECAAASAQFDALVECVVCDACADACAGEWTCGDDPNDGEDGGGEDGGGEDGGDEDGGDEEMPDDEDPCQYGGDGDCEDEDPGEEQPPGDDEEEDPCQYNGDGDCGEGEASECLGCIKEATDGECHELVAACLEHEGCSAVAHCVQECGQDAECAGHCLEEGMNVDYVEQVLECALCNACADQCPVDPWCG